jgi:hypothetical protein
MMIWDLEDVRGLNQSELKAYDQIKPGHVISWFKQNPRGRTSVITCCVCGARGEVSEFGCLGLIFQDTCENIRNSDIMTALVQGKVVFFDENIPVAI